MFLKEGARSTRAMGTGEAAAARYFSARLEALAAGRYAFIPTYINREGRYCLEFAKDELSLLYGHI